MKIEKVVSLLSKFLINFSQIFSTASAVDFLCLKPNCKEDRSLNLRKNLYILLYIHFSNNLETVGKSDKGL